MGREQRERKRKTERGGGGMVRNEDTETEKAKISDKVRELERKKRDGAEERDVEGIQGAGTENSNVSTKRKNSAQMKQVVSYHLAWGKKKVKEDLKLPKSCSREAAACHAPLIGSDSY